MTPLSIQGQGSSQQEARKNKALTRPVTGAANNGSGLIRITAANHGLATGNRVQIAGVGGTVEANGNWRVTVISASTFDLIGSAFAVAYTSGGTATRTHSG